MNNKMAVNMCLSTIESKSITEIDTENIFTVARWERVEEIGEKGEGINNYKLVVTKQSWEYKV